MTEKSGEQNWKVIVWDYEEDESAIVEANYKADDKPIAILPPGCKHTLLLAAAPQMKATIEDAIERLDRLYHHLASIDQAVAVPIFKMIEPVLDRCNETIVATESEEEVNAKCRLKFNVGLAQFTPNYVDTFEDVTKWLDANNVPYEIDDSEGHDVNRICVKRKLTENDTAEVRKIFEANREDWVD